METAVRKATRLEYRPPKEKHLLTLKNSTFENPASIDGILMNLEKRLKEHSWIITYKVLVILHYLMRQGNCVRVVDAIIKRPSVLDASRIKNKSHSPANVQNIYMYRAYLDERIIAYKSLKRDHAAESSKQEGRLRHLLVKDGLLKETTVLQRQMESVLKCKFHLNEKDPQITLFAYKLVIEDLLAIFQSINEGVVNILEHYFELNKADATDALDIYKTFAQQAELTIDYLNEARKLENDIQLSIPPIKHAPLSLAAALEEYLNDGSADQVDNSQAKAVSRNNTTQRQQSLKQQSTPQPIQQPMQQPSQQIYSQNPQLQNGSVTAQQADMDAAFSTANRKPTAFSLAPQAPLVQNPFSNQSPFSQAPANTNFTSQFATISGPGYAPPSSSSPFTRSATFSSTIAGHGSSNPFRSMSMNSSNNYGSWANTQQQQQQIVMAKPLCQQGLQPQITGSRNPFSPVTPPLSPNPPLSSFMNPPQPSYSSNPFITQQQNAFNANNV
ncbi:hypothetical protein [Parasitella parasitica]|uniref:ENTH domain-containing protein n=1 Tax=Parasitella parasitica TaxID=35722 RepID=A0A0B7NL01_9FUNG|nr:hypothetical protein [Parasitella parasitica]